MTATPKSYPNGKRWMTQGEAAAYLSTSPQTLKSWPVAPRVRPDGRKIYDIRDLDNFADTMPLDGDNGGGDATTGWEDVDA